MTDYAQLARAAGQHLGRNDAACVNFRMVEIAKVIARQDSTPAGRARRVHTFAAALAEQVEIEARGDVTALRRAGL